MDLGVGKLAPKRSIIIQLYFDVQVDDDVGNDMKGGHLEKKNLEPKCSQQSVDQNIAERL